MKANKSLFLQFNGNFILGEIIAFYITVKKKAIVLKGHVDWFYGELFTNISKFYPGDI